jgi:uncharacterized protein YegP (UPF0339 family)
MKKRSQVVIYKDRKGEWRWRFVAPNGRVLADSGEGYKRKAGAVKAFERLVYYVSYFDEAMVFA